MAMIIAWQTVNAVRRPGSKLFTRGFLVVTPGITIKDRLRVLQPNDPDNYYAHRELVPRDMLGDIGRAVIVITNYHAFRLRERMEISKGGRALLQGRTGAEVSTLETEGERLRDVMPGLLGMRDIMVINDEAHHCYREKPDHADEGEISRDESEEAEVNSEAARLWINGLDMVNRKIGVSRVFDLSATPFFLRGSGYPEGYLFPWTACDFSLMDAIECGIVKLPRVPVVDNVPGTDMPTYRNLWEHIGSRMPKKRRAKGANLDPESLPTELKTALDILYGHYLKTFELWERADKQTHPCFIIVCSNTASSKLVYDYVSGFTMKNGDGGTIVQNGKHPLFRNFDENGIRYPRPRTILIDSAQLESGEALDDNFRAAAADEIEQFKREIRERTRDWKQAENLTDQDLLREAMNTVGKPGRLGDSVRCVVSVSMLSEGWDASTVTHVLGVRAFGTQLLCEQVIGRALRRQSYDLNDTGLFSVEYADVLGIPFDFTAKPVPAPAQPPVELVQVMAVSPERDALEITFPRISGYRVDLPEERISAAFTEDSVLKLTPELVGPSRVVDAGIIGSEVTLDLSHLERNRTASIVYHLTHRLLVTKWKDPEETPKFHLFGQLKRIVREWMDTCLECSGGTYPAQLLYQELMDMACQKITAAITRSQAGNRPVKAVLDPFNPTGSTMHVNFTTAKTNRYRTDPRKSHINWVITDSGWEAEFCRIAEAHPRVICYVKNQNLGFEVPYRFGSTTRTYIPDFIVRVDDGRSDPLNLVVEIKGYRGEDAKAKKETMETCWVPGVNNLGRFGRWDFLELCDIMEMESGFAARVSERITEAAEKGDHHS
jgi:type III restriction enzyme